MVDAGLTFLAWVIVAGVAATLLDALIGGRRIRRLADIAPASHGSSVSIIVAARDEARGIEPAVRSLLRLDYPDLELIVVNDRSTDQTGAILRRVQADDPRLHVVTIDTLPDGWLGKNHALAAGAAQARGDILLFTDADIIFEPTTIARAVRYMTEQGLDHLTALPDVQLNGVALRALVTTFGVLFSVYTRPWKARDPRSRHHIGVGAFNMVTASAYQRMGTHAAIALRPDDDLRLAREVKRAGLRQDVVHAKGLLSVEWYASVGEMIDGLMKNAFAGVNYSVLALVASTVALFAFNVWPVLALLFTSGDARLLSAVTVVLLALLVMGHTHASGLSPAYALLHPVGVLVFIYILWRSAALALGRGAIVWRGTGYPLARLKASLPAARLETVSPRRATDSAAQ